LRNVKVALVRSRWDASGVDEPEQVERRVRLPAPPEEVWAEVADPGRLSAWFGAHVELDLRPGGRASFRWPDGTERGGVIEEVEPGKLLAFRWVPFERLSDGTPVRRPIGRVEVALVTAPGGQTDLVVRETVDTAPVGIDDARTSAVLT
jgi:uncharacterized protein YndB with AHSA1/START domain